MLRNVGVEEFTPELKVYYNRLPVVNLDRLFGMGGAPGLVIQDGEITGAETRICRRRCLKMIVIVFLIFLILAGSVLISRAKGGGRGAWMEYLEEICKERNICPELVEAVIEQESSWDPAAVNGDCIGLMQISQIAQWPRMQELGVVNLTDPYENILVGVDLLEELFHRYRDPAAVLMYYNAGYSGRFGLGAYLQGEISDYAEQVLQRAAELEVLHGK